MRRDEVEKQDSPYCQGARGPARVMPEGSGSG